jgi:1-acyl-sn-glycerol-3-phosphate acyltransferase
MPSRTQHRLLRMWVPLSLPLIRVFIRRLVRIETVGRHRLPRAQPFLLFSNHVAFLDPVVLGVAAARPIQFVGSEALLKSWGMRMFVRLFGYIPTQKMRSDIQALKLMKKWSDAGAILGVFPEGRRSWDSRPVELLPGIEKLVRFFNVPVVTARLVNGDRQAPFWAARQRRGRIRVEFDPPVTFPRSTDSALVRQHIVNRVTVDPGTSPRWPMRGFGRAAGVTNLLFACPVCFATAGLDEGSEMVACAKCGRRWQVTTENRLAGRNGADDFAIPVAYDRIVEHLRAADWLPEPELYRQRGRILESEPMLLRSGPRQRRIVGRGALVLTASELLVEGEMPWQLPLVAIAAVAVDVRTRLMFRTPTALFEAVLPVDSAIKWVLVAEHWRQAARRGL